MEGTLRGKVFRTGEREKIPQGAVLLSRNEALSHQMEIVQSWKTDLAYLPIVYGPSAVGLLGAASAIFLTNFYRKKLMLRSYGRISSYFANTVATGTIATVVHHKLITEDIVLDETPCQSCVDLRAASVQMVIGILYPAVLAPVICFSLANAYRTYPVPDMRKSYREVFQLWKTFTQPALGKFGVMMCLQALATIVVVKLQRLSMEHIMREIEKRSN